MSHQVILISIALFTAADTTSARMYQAPLRLCDQYGAEQTT